MFILKHHFVLQTLFFFSFKDLRNIHMIKTMVCRLQIKKGDPACSKLKSKRMDSHLSDLIKFGDKLR